MPDMTLRLVQIACGFVLAYAVFSFASEVLPIEPRHGISAPDTTFSASAGGVPSRG